MKHIFLLSFALLFAIGAFFSCSASPKNEELIFLEANSKEQATLLDETMQERPRNKSEGNAGFDRFESPQADSSSLPEALQKEEHIAKPEGTLQEQVQELQKEAEPEGEANLAPEKEIVSEKKIEPEKTNPICPQGITCVTNFPYSNQSNTKNGSKRFARYSCKSKADESGPERIYRVQLKQAGFLSAAVYDSTGVDVDVHILSSLDENACLDRGDSHARVDVKAGTYYVVVDSFTKNGKAHAGTYRVDIGFVIPSKGSCAMKKGIMKRVRDGGKHLKMPATGPIVIEAHLVTRKEPPPYPKSFTDKLKAHYTLSQKVSKFVMYRSQKWAPLEGGSFYGAGIRSPKYFPVLDEAWYVNMYWTRLSRPSKGTKMILRIPGTKRAVVVAAGYETGPGNLAHIGGTTEETHFYMRTKHRSVMQLGISTDQALPLGPRICQ